jgi:hypothetical protein
MGNRVANYPIHQDAQVLQTQNANSLHAQQVAILAIWFMFSNFVFYCICKISS